MKQFTNFSLGFFGPEAIATKPLGKHKYMDWKRVQQIVSANPDSVIYAGLQEDWNNTSGLIFAKGKFYDGGSFYGSSNWATPIVDVDGCEIECYTYEKTEEDYRMPKWWGDGQPLLSSYDYKCMETMKRMEKIKIHLLLLNI